jgi:hypothetical protein
MAKVAIVVLAGTETHEGLGRVVNALEAVKEFKEARDDVKLILTAPEQRGSPSSPSRTTRRTGSSLRSAIA